MIFGGERALGAAVIFQLLDDVEAYESYLQENRAPVRRNTPRISRIIRDGADAVHCLHSKNHALALWASLACIDMPQLEITIKKRFPRSYTTIWGVRK